MKTIIEKEYLKFRRLVTNDSCFTTHLGSIYRDSALQGDCGKCCRNHCHGDGNDNKAKVNP